MTSLLITGATGTFGRAAIPLALKSGYERICIFSRDEAKQHELRLQYASESRLRWFIGDVRDKERLKMALRGVTHVIHAAALKHVIAGEYSPGEFVKTNVGGAQNLVEAAIESHVSQVIALSTDKAVNPINLYGATKLCAERIFLASNVLDPHGCRFSVTRYGNVVGSRGSFVELLYKLRYSGATRYPLRSAESTRFWISPEDAASFVLRRLQGMEGGEVFVPKMPSSLVTAFAQEHFPGGIPDIVGVPAGEKIHEILITPEESQYTTEYETFFAIRPYGPRQEKPMWTYRSDR
jgi:UDP-N-acetylglucosamine 4,6-dehydratase/5-epimerase